MKQLNAFPEFMRGPGNAVDLPDAENRIAGALFEGADGSQTVFWECPQGGKVKTHAHEFDEYCIIVQGTYTGTVGGKKVVTSAGEELFIPAGVPHGGEMSVNYRSVDVWAGRRFKTVRAVGAACP